MEHLSPEAIESVLMGVSSADSESIRRHLGTCELCAARLQREAQLETLLYSAAVSSGNVGATPHGPPRIAWQVMVQVAAALAILIGGVLWLDHARHVESEFSPDSQLESVGMADSESTVRANTAPGWDVESPRDYGKRANPEVPCLESITTSHAGASDSL